MSEISFRYPRVDRQPRNGDIAVCPKPGPSVPSGGWDASNGYNAEDLQVGVRNGLSKERPLRRAI